MANIAELDKLVHLDVRGTRITDDAIMSILKLQNLEHLELAETKVSHKHLRSLLKLQKLRTVFLPDHLYELDDAKHLQSELLKRN